MEHDSENTKSTSLRESLRTSSESWSKFQPIFMDDAYIKWGMNERKIEFYRYDIDTSNSYVKRRIILTQIASEEALINFYYSLFRSGNELQVNFVQNILYNMPSSLVGLFRDDSNFGSSQPYGHDY